MQGVWFNVDSPSPITFVQSFNSADAFANIAPLVAVSRQSKQATAMRGQIGLMFVHSMRLFRISTRDIIVVETPARLAFRGSCACHEVGAVMGKRVLRTQR
jgi:hypothetical protein